MKNITYFDNFIIDINKDLNNFFKEKILSHLWFCQNGSYYTNSKTTNTYINKHIFTLKNKYINILNNNLQDSNIISFDWNFDAKIYISYVLE